MISAISAIDQTEMSEGEIAAAISSYKRSKQQSLPDNKNDKSKKCLSCGYDWPHPGGRESCPAKGKTCNNCKKPNHFESVSKSKKSKGVSSILFSTIHKINSMSAEQEGSLPKLNVLIGIDNDEAPVMTEVVADTGAQATVAGYQHLRHLGIKQKDLRTPTHSLRHAGGSNLEILGSYPIYIIHNDKLIEDEIYFVKGVKNLYLSLASCQRISIVHKNFPDIKHCIRITKIEYRCKYCAAENTINIRNEGINRNRFSWKKNPDPSYTTTIPSI